MSLLTTSCLVITLDVIPTSRSGRNYLHRPKVNRKETRKLDREVKKRRKAEYFSSSTNSKRIAIPHPESPPPKRTTVAESLRPRSSEVQLRKRLSRRPSELASKDARAIVSSRISSSHVVKRPTLPRLPRTREEEDEDRYIALLEAKLTSGKRSKSGAGYFGGIENDGLGGE